MRIKSLGRDASNVVDGRTATNTTTLPAAMLSIWSRGMLQIGIETLLRTPRDKINVAETVRFILLEESEEFRLAQGSK